MLLQPPPPVVSPQGGPSGPGRFLVRDLRAYLVEYIAMH